MSVDKSKSALQVNKRPKDDSDDESKDVTENKSDYTNTSNPKSLVSLNEQILSIASTPIKIVAVCGSLRKKSCNTACLKYAQTNLPPNVTFEILSIADIPLFNQDLEDSNVKTREANGPKSVAIFKQKIRESDAIFFGICEYNLGVSGVLKNALDWASRRPYCLKDKPATCIGAAGGSGSMNAQLDLRKWSIELGIDIMNNPLVMIKAFEKDIFNWNRDNDKEPELISVKWQQRIVTQVRLLRDYALKKKYAKLVFNEISAAKVLIIGRNQDIMDKVLEGMAKQNFAAKGVVTDDAVLKELKENEYDVLMFGGGVESESLEKINKYIEENKINIKSFTGNK
eukprot:CAMPEP_0201569500 /NCGR_PEP_ID=MMETSP0190_2-20130828/11211_1 /ASSEMBLY_ACC=CAM_ASM_000263 /TAXON_ID=37353 /ORGANISM="Rosalina sp." /LENGTH=340 /DNA_ID=CAMNT_0047991869 /DNA_START=12 /DNA_END=1031 /DNA_ORIENTATION=-